MQNICESYEGIPSKTIPGQSYPLRFLLERARRGQPVHFTDTGFDLDPAEDPTDDVDPLNTFGLDVNEAYEVRDRMARDTRSRVKSEREAAEVKRQAAKKDTKQDTPPQGV